MNMGSRFCSGAESRYSPIEGELLALLWSLDKTKYWTLGNQNLFMFTDHKRLLGLADTKCIDEIPNPRLCRLVETIHMWKFTLKHISGKKNCTSDALSRFPWTPQEDLVECLGKNNEDKVEQSGEIDALVSAELKNPRWEQVKEMTVEDKILNKVKNSITEGKDVVGTM